MSLGYSTHVGISGTKTLFMLALLYDESSHNGRAITLVSAIQVIVNRLLYFKAEQAQLHFVIRVAFEVANRMAGLDPFTASLSQHNARHQTGNVHAQWTQVSQTGTFKFQCYFERLVSFVQG